MPDIAAVDPLDFGVDLGSVRDRIDLLGYFLSVTDILQASEALDEKLPAAPPAAFVAVASERAEPNREINGHAQRVNVMLSILFAERAARFDRKAKERMELTRKALIRQLVAWTPRNAQRPLQYDRFRVAGISDGIVWGEVSFVTAYRLSI